MWFACLHIVAVPSVPGFMHNIHEVCLIACADTCSRSRRAIRLACGQVQAQERGRAGKPSLSVETRKVSQNRRMMVALCCFFDPCPNEFNSVVKIRSGTTYRDIAKQIMSCSLCVLCVYMYACTLILLRAWNACIRI